MLNPAGPDPDFAALHQAGRFDFSFRCRFDFSKRGNENVPEKQARSKKQKIEAESSSQSYKKAKKMKRILVEPLKEEDESISSDFDEEGIHANLRCTNWSANDTPIPLAWRGARGKGCIFSENCLPCFRNLAWFYVIRASSANERDAQVENELKGMKKNLKSMEKQCDPMFEFFKEAGEVIEVQLAAKKDGSFLGFGRVEFSTGTDAQRQYGLLSDKPGGLSVRPPPAPAQLNAKFQCQPSSAYRPVIAQAARPRSQVAVRGSPDQPVQRPGLSTRQRKPARPRGLSSALFSSSWLFPVTAARFSCTPGSR
ncbi:Nucleolin 2 [Platanthera zijinensis]|uniref:Nucleolin 2 n=1 Tax=Platanthera zijinensis TaxID=2320716 RepID=A0AAP0FSD6_9ASPA